MKVDYNLYVYVKWLIQTTHLIAYRSGHTYWSQELAYRLAIVGIKVDYILRMRQMEGQFQIWVGPT